MTSGYIAAATRWTTIEGQEEGMAQSLTYDNSNTEMLDALGADSASDDNVPVQLVDIEEGTA